MSDTPRTDVAEWRTNFANERVVHADFARELERELAAAKKRIAELEPDFRVAARLLRAELAAMRQQRDEARELYCVEAAQHSVCRRSVMDAWTIARYRGWEGLFKQGGGA